MRSRQATFTAFTPTGIEYDGCSWRYRCVSAISDDISPVFAPIHPAIHPQIAVHEIGHLSTSVYSPTFCLYHAPAAVLFTCSSQLYIPCELLSLFTYSLARSSIALLPGPAVLALINFAAFTIDAACGRNRHDAADCGSRHPVETTVFTPEYFA